ncbi:DUF937 domain-containing protein [Mycobacterium malmoense]|uniref:DUF937 domain-containing protein n=1 Tax=Mycobacterium malmoense TaxID=1780 RepID=A0ABX3SLC4_MYCMA|nr:DUF937 domain-containing protein [Mycobacterium malmoense]ORA77391.1 hypothetical protein BST29_23485 [Mycobacterium malmoense]QZA20160.1 DUF937 domain-containing protein [Mycobacterium malmoense]UNB96915.1 DUF937 domain-containing protein [Mycobacterium malmoense]
MAGLDDLYSQIPTSEIATKLGADEGDVENAVRTLVPALLGGLEQNSQDPEHASRIESIASSHAARGLLDVGGGTAQGGDGHEAIAALFGGNDADQVASALADSGAGNRDLLKQLLPVVLPIVLAYIGKQLGPGGRSGAPEKEAAGGGLGGVLGGILAGGSGDKSLGGILGNVLGGKGGALGDILGGLLGGKK